MSKVIFLLSPSLSHNKIKKQSNFISNLISFVEIQKSKKIDSHEGKRDSLLDSFCDYSNELNPEDDISDPRHWDIGILVTGLDMWVESNGVRNDASLGVARTKGMCHYKYSCAVGKFKCTILSHHRCNEERGQGVP